MGKRIREYDWSSTSLGNPESWPHSLKTCVRIMLTSPQPMFVWWGADLINIYNDAYRYVMGGKHPKMLGWSGKDAWKEIWADLLPRVETVFERNEGTFDDALLLVMNRNGYDEETYFKFSYNPIPGPNGGTEGLFCACTDETDRIVNDRALETLRLLGAINQTQDLQDLFGAAAKAIEKNNNDFPFAIIYFIDEETKQARAVAFAGTSPEKIELPFEINSGDNSEMGKNLWECVTENKIVVSSKEGKWKQLPLGAWNKPPQQFTYVPIKAGNKKNPVAVLFLALNPFRKFDEKYRNFVQLVADQISLEASGVLAFEEESNRAKALAEIDQAKTAFFANISHEFRTPLTLILGSLEELLGKKEIKKEEEHQVVETAHRNAMRLLRLVNNLLDFSSLEAGRMKAKYQRTDISSFTNNLASNFRSAIENAGLQFQVLCEKVDQPVYLDREMWEKVVLNLLSNAFKYTLNGSIRLSLETSENTVVIKVSDTGVGIPESELPRMFERFHRVQNVTGRTFEGTGIGLSLVKELVHLHGGEISVASREGQGSEFTVTIPTGRIHLKPEQIIETEADLDITSIDPFIQEGSSLADLTKTENGSLMKEGLSTVLVVDDNADMCTYIKNLLQNHYNVITAGNGIDAILRMTSHPIDLVVSDIMMPGMDGIELLKAIKESPQTATLPVILVSARAGEESRIEGYQRGADDYLIKPFSAKELLARVASQIRLYKKRKGTENQLRNLFEQAPALIHILKGPDHVFEFFHPKGKEIVGGRDLTGMKIREALPEYEGQGYFELLDEVYQKGITVSQSGVHSLLKNEKGEMVERYFDAIWQPFRNEKGSIEGVLNFAVEVTEQVKARKSVEDSEKRYNMMLMQSPFAFAIFKGKEMIITLANDSMKEVLGKGPDIEDKPLLDVLPELKGQAFPDLLNNVLTTGTPYFANEALARLHRNGRLEDVYFNFVYQPYWEVDKSISGITVIAYEVTNEVLAKKKIEASEAYFRQLTETLPQLIWMTDDQGAQLYASSRWAEYTGISPTGFETWKQIIHPVDLETIGIKWRECLKNGDTYYAEARLKNKHGEYRWHFANGVPVKNEEGIIVKWIGSFTDIHDQKELFETLEKLVRERTKELQRSNEDLQQFAHVASHDLKEPVRKIKTFGGRLMHEYGNELPEKARTYLEKIESATNRVYAMIDGVLMYSALDSQDVSIERIDLNEIIRSLESDLEILVAQKNATILYQDLPSFDGSPVLIYQLFYNLINNSLKFSQAGLNPIVEVKSEIIHSRDSSKNNLGEAEYIVLTVKDNGIGFSVLDKEKIFNTFYRLHAKDKYDGTGLGLSLCKKIVERHSGSISAIGEENEGATFRIVLPVKQPKKI